MEAVLGFQFMLTMSVVPPKCLIVRKLLRVRAWIGGFVRAMRNFGNPAPCHPSPPRTCQGTIGGAGQELSFGSIRGQSRGGSGLLSSLASGPELKHGDSFGNVWSFECWSSDVLLQRSRDSEGATWLQAANSRSSLSATRCCHSLTLSCAAACSYSASRRRAR